VKKGLQQGLVGRRLAVLLLVGTWERMQEEEGAAAGRRGQVAGQALAGWDLGEVAGGGGREGVGAASCADGHYGSEQHQTNAPSQVGLLSMAPPAAAA